MIILWKKVDYGVAILFNLIDHNYPATPEIAFSHESGVEKKFVLEASFNSTTNNVWADDYLSLLLFEGQK